jgi:hypothetical protein
MGGHAVVGSSGRVDCSVPAPACPSRAPHDLSSAGQALGKT